MYKMYFSAVLKNFSGDKMARVYVRVILLPRVILSPNSYFRRQNDTIPDVSFCRRVSFSRRRQNETRRQNDTLKPPFVDIRDVHRQTDSQTHTHTHT